MDWRALTQVTPNTYNYRCFVLNLDTLPDSFTIYFYLQVKELGVVVYNCSSLAKDLHKIFQSYWVMGQSNSSLPQHWPAKYDTAINKHHPLLVKMDNVSSRLYLTVSSFYFSSVLQDTVLLMDKGLLSLFTQKWKYSMCIAISARTTSKRQTVTLWNSDFYESNALLFWWCPYLWFPPGFSTIILSSIEDSGPGCYSLHHLRGPTLCPCRRHGVLPHHTLWKSSEVNLTHKRNLFVSMKLLPCFRFISSLWSLSLNRYWPFIDDAIRAAAFERKVKIRMLISCGQDSDPAMLPFLQSLASIDSPHQGISVQIVRPNME